MGTLNTWVFWLKQISETSSFHSFWFNFKGMNHLKIETHLIPVRENPPSHPWKLGMLTWQFCWWAFLNGKKRWSFQRLSEVTSSNRVGDFFKVPAHPCIHPPKLEKFPPRFCPNEKKRRDPSWVTQRNARRFLRGIARLLLAVFGGALSYGSRGALDGAPSAAARLRQWPGGWPSCGDGEGLKEPARPQKSLKDPAWG